METEDTTCTEQVETPQEETTCTECNGPAHEDEGYYWHGDLVCCGCHHELICFSIELEIRTDREEVTA